MSLDPALEEALNDAFARLEPLQTDEFKRRFRRLVENALIANQTDPEIRRVLELVTITAEGDA